MATDLIKRAGEQAYTKAALKLFAAQRVDTISRLRQVRDKSDFELAMQVFDLARWYEETLERFGPLVAGSVVQGYRTGAERIGAEIPFPVGDPRAKAIALRVLEKPGGLMTPF